MTNNPQNGDVMQTAFDFETSPPIAVTHDIPADPVAFYRELLEEHHQAVLAADEEKVRAIRKKARQLAADLNGDTMCGIAAHDGSGTSLMEQTTAPEGAIPLWGQSGNFIVRIGEMRVRIELEGIFGIGCSTDFYPGFAAHIVDKEKPFFSETGYRSFLGVHAEPLANLTPDEYVRQAIVAHITTLGKRKRKSR